MSELVPLAKIVLCNCDARPCGVFIYIYITKTLGRKEKGDFTEKGKILKN